MKASRLDRVLCWAFGHRDMDEGGGRHVRIIRCARCRRVTYKASVSWRRRQAEIARERARKHAEPER